MRKHYFKVFLFEIIGIILIIISLLLVQNPFNSHVTEYDIRYTTESNDNYYTEDYAEKYKDTFKVMFGDDYVIFPPQSEHSEKCDCQGGGHNYYKSWKISYKDGNGSKQIFHFRNDLPLNFCIKQHAEQQVKILYMDYYNEAFEYIPLRQSSDLYCSLADIRCNESDVPEMCNAIDKYLKSTETPENCIKFCQLTKENAFELMPIEIDAHIFIDIENLSAEQIVEYREKAEKASMSFLSTLNKMTDNAVNIYFLIDDDTTGDTRKFYIKGKEIQSDSFVYERDVFKSYEEQFYS